MIPATLFMGGSSFQLSISPTFINYFSGSASGTTDSITVSVVGGAGSNVFDWERISGSFYITATTDNAATTTFSFSFPVSGSFSTTFRCTVTDASGVSDYVDITVTISYEDFT